MTKETSSNKAIINSTLVISLIGVIIKFLGLVKQSVLAAYCGATEETDIFFLVTGVLASLCTMVFSAISVSLLTIHTDKLIFEGRESANDLINKVLRCFIPISFFITIFFILTAPWIAKFLSPTYTSDQIMVMAKYIRMMSFVFVLWCYFLTINVVLETDKRFIPGRGQNLFQNIFLIIAAILVYSRTSIDSLIWAFLLSGLAECILVTWCARKQFKFIWGTLQTPNSEIKTLYNLAIPLIIGSAVYEVNDIVDKQISSSLGEGNVSYLNYGSTINEIVTGVIVMALSTVLFSHFASWVSEGNTHKLERTLKICMTYLTFTILPIITLCTFAGDDIVRILYARGSFGETEVYYTYYVSIGYAVGFLFSSIRAILIKVIYAFKDTRGAMVNGIVSVLLNIILSIFISRLLGVWGISLATSIAMLFSTILLCVQIRKHLPSFSIVSERRELIKELIAFVVSSAITCLSSRLLDINNIILSFGCKAILCIFSYLTILIISQSHIVISICSYIAKSYSIHKK